MTKSLSPDLLLQEVLSGSKYAHLHPGFVERICAQELAKGRSQKETVKAVRSKLHQAGAAYQEHGINYAQLKKQLAELGANPARVDLKIFCRTAMMFHASTSERLPILDDFFSQTLQEIAPIRSVLDLACGLNPLAIPWMPLTSDATYTAGDIYLDLVEFLNTFFQSIKMLGVARPLDLAVEIPQQPVHLALLLKTLPCMEQQVKDYGIRLLDTIQAEHLLVSFPIQSLGGRSKGMIAHYDEYLRQITVGRNWRIKRFDFSCELAYLISK
jgi:16S rRNA (guanine(1405)-N(7))-methyltransferase